MKIKKIKNAYGLVGNVVDSLDAIGVGDVPNAMVVKAAINGTILYDNENGSTGNFIISDDISNYAYVDVIYECDYYKSVKRVPVSNSMLFSTFICYCDSSQNFMYLFVSNWAFTDGTMCRYLGSRNNYINDITLNSYGNTSYIKIIKVIGYK